MKFKETAFVHRDKRPEKYKAAREKLKEMERHACAKYRAELVKELSSNQNSSKWWEIVKAHSGTQAARSVATSNVDCLAVHFAKKLTIPNADDPVPDFDHGVPVKLLSFRITRRRVFQVLSKLDPKESMMNVSPMVLKNCADVLADAVYSLFKSIADAAQWPTKFFLTWDSGLFQDKLINGLPSGAKAELSVSTKNYRSIVGLDNLSLCFERAVDSQFDGWLFKFIPECQFGFRKSCGTDVYGAAVSGELSEALEKLWEVLLISLDVAGAFDKVWWKALLAKGAI